MMLGCYLMMTGDYPMMPGCYPMMPGCYPMMPDCCLAIYWGVRWTGRAASLSSSISICHQDTGLVWSLLAVGYSIGCRLYILAVKLIREGYDEDVPKQ